MLLVGEILSKTEQLYRSAMPVGDEGPTKHALYWVVHSHTCLEYTKRRKPNVFAARVHSCSEGKCTGSAYEGAKLGVYR